MVASHGEGFGLTYSESLAVGTPVIALSWGGQLDFLNAENSYLVPPAGLEDTISEDGEKVKWAAIDIAALSERLRYVFENSAEAKHRAALAQRDVVRDWTWDNAGRLAARALMDLNLQKNAA